MNNGGIEQLFIQNIASLATAGAFIYYLIRKDNDNRETYECFNKTIQNHLKHSRKTEADLAKSLQRLADSIESLKNK